MCGTFPQRPGAVLDGVGSGERRSSKEQKLKVITGISYSLNIWDMLNRKTHPRGQTNTNIKLCYYIREKAIGQ